jgi:hypothetical protein
MRATLTMLAPLLLAGCTAMDGADTTSREARALDRRLAERVAGEPQTCISQRQGVSLHAVDSRTIVYDDGRDIWVNRLEAACPGLRPGATLIVEPFGDRFCRNDRIRALEAGAAIPGPYCRLGSFTPYRARD